ncbi:YqgE/AlgH family protein [Pseudooceanicola algae]|nr:YqgE/AlgH family protein [Pseudooceanicola algae]
MAMPAMEDPRFANSVILLCAHSDDGAMGLMVNKPVDRMVKADLFEQLGVEGCAEALAGRVHSGGPVERERGFVLHSADYDSALSSLDVSEDLRMTATLDILEDIAMGDGPRRVLFALGYCGWGPGQLEAEIGQNGWLIGAADTETIFGVDDARKWTRALAEEGLDPLVLSGVAGRA